MDRVLPTYPPGRSASAQRQLERLGVDGPARARTVTDIDEQSVRVGRRPTRRHRGGDPGPDRALGAPASIASSFARKVAAGDRRRDRPQRPRPRRARPDGARPPRDLRGRRRRGAAVERRISRRPGVAQGGIQGGSYAAKVIRRRMLGRPYEPFRYSNHGDVAVIGRLSGVTNIPWLGPFGQQGGFTAWLLWLGIHIAYLIGFANRIVVLIRWAWSFITHGRGTRLITGGRCCRRSRSRSRR